MNFLGLDIRFIEFLQAGGMGALFMLIAARYAFDYIFAKKEKKEKTRDEEERQNNRAKLDQIQSSIDSIRGNLDTLTAFLSAKKK